MSSPWLSLRGNALWGAKQPPACITGRIPLSLSPQPTGLTSAGCIFPFRLSSKLSNPTALKHIMVSRFSPMHLG